MRVLKNLLPVYGVAATALDILDGSKPAVTSEMLQNAITEENLMSNLDTLQKIASRNNNHRAFGYSGWDESVSFITSRLAQLSETSSFYLQEFSALWTSLESISLKINGIDTYIVGLRFSPSTSPEGVTLPLVLGAAGDGGCSVDGYAGLNDVDKAVLLERNRCPDGSTLAGRIRPAVAAGAAVVIIYNNETTNVTGFPWSLGGPDPEHFKPSGFINNADGRPIVAKLQAGEPVEIYFQQTQLLENKTTHNIIAETKGGDPNNVIAVGAHLDSFFNSPGINDNGSGTSLVLELFTALSRFSHNLKVRAIWWGAEEEGSVGSEYYTQNLGPANSSVLRAYLNFDMVSRGYFGVFDGDGSSFNVSWPAGSDVIESLFVDDLTSKGIDVTPVKFSETSDYQWFFKLGFPTGGLHTGSDKAQDSCYHLPCDTYSNANSTILTINAKTAANAVAKLATDGDKLLPRRECQA